VGLILAGGLAYRHPELFIFRHISKLAWDFGEDFDAPNAGGYAKISAILISFDPHHRGLATYPLLFAVGEFRRENQDHLEFAAFAYLRVGINKDSIGA